MVQFSDITRQDAFAYAHLQREDGALRAQTAVLRAMRKPHRLLHCSRLDQPL